MQSRNLVCALALGLVAAAGSGAAAGTLAERNLDWLLAFAGFDAVPEGSATITSVEGASVVPAAHAFAALALRADGVDLESLAANDGPGAGLPQLGDVWVIEHGEAPCPAPALFTPTPVPFLAPSAGLWIYPGGAGVSQTTQSYSGLMFSWTLKTTESYAGGGHTFAGQSDFYCVEFGDERLSFPFLDGAAAPNGEE